MKKKQKVQKKKQKTKNNKLSLKGSVALIAALFWVLTAQFYVAQYIVARAMDTPFSLVNNFISDLGATLCGPETCSTLYQTMNVSFVLLGLCIIAGALLFSLVFRENIGLVVAFICLAISGLGTILVGLYPSDINGAAHGTGAYTSFLVGNVALIVIGLSLGEVKSWLRLSALFLGVVGLIFLPFFMTNMYLGLGLGTVERIVAYPQTIWMITFGLYVIFGHFKPRKTIAT